MKTAAQVATDRQAMLREIQAGLREAAKTLPSKYFYDERGSDLFEQICELEAYYPTRTEIGILEKYGSEMARAAGPGVQVVEYGSGASVKTRMLLAALDEPVSCVLIDISREHVLASARRLQGLFPSIHVEPYEGDYTQALDVPASPRPASRRVVFFPGSTIGNFDRAPARDFLSRMARVAGPGGGLLIGVDLIKDAAVLERAYDDPEGVTAAFNLNLLRHLNRELGSDFDLEAFRHRAVWNAADRRIEMYLESLRDQAVRVGEERFEIAAGERLCTEHSNKFDLEEFAELAKDAGWRVRRTWTDARRWFSVQYLETSS
ncbi:MAG: L-histidine N(alpha)-methyltransferase [Acidobacteriota bacterium]